MRHSKILSIFSVSIFLASCVTTGYTPPTSKNSAKNTFTINKSYDETYSSLVDVLASTFFAIDNFDKASGLITLSYSASGDVSKYIDCGNWVNENPLYPNLNFDGKYEDYLVRNFNDSLNGRLNIVVKSISKNQTKLVVNSRYSFGDFTFTGVEDALVRVNNSAIKDNPVRICRPTGYVENLIAEKITNL